MSFYPGGNGHIPIDWIFDCLTKKLIYPIMLTKFEEENPLMSTARNLARLFNNEHCKKLADEIRKKDKEFKKINEQYEALPHEAKDDSLNPITEIAKEERKEAHGLDNKMTALSIEMEKLYDKFEACNNAAIDDAIYKLCNRR